MALQPTMGMGVFRMSGGAALYQIPGREVAPLIVLPLTATATMGPVTWDGGDITSTVIWIYTYATRSLQWTVINSGTYPGPPTTGAYAVFLDGVVVTTYAPPGDSPWHSTQIGSCLAMVGGFAQAISFGPWDWTIPPQS